MVTVEYTIYKYVNYYIKKWIHAYAAQTNALHVAVFLCHLDINIDIN